MFTSANSIAGNIYSAITDVDSYFGLKSENKSLIDHNRELTNSLEELKAQLREYEECAAVAEYHNTAQSHDGF